MREFMLIIHFIGLAMGLGTSFAFMFLGIASSKMEQTEAHKFMLKAFALTKMGQIGLVLLIVSGGYLMTPYWKTLSSIPLLIIKLVLVLILAALIGYISAIAKKASQGETAKHLKKIRTVGQLALFIAIAIVILAVYIFH